MDAVTGDRGRTAGAHPFAHADPIPRAPASPGPAPASTADAGPLSGTATLLTDGRVLVAGGCDPAAELYDPAADAFTATGSMTAVPAGATATRLADGRVLFTGGSDCGDADTGGIWASAELYDPATSTFSPTGSMRTPRENQTRRCWPTVAC